MDNAMLAPALETLGYQVTPHDDSLEIGFDGDGPDGSRPTAVAFRGPTRGMVALMVSTTLPFTAPEGRLHDLRLAAAECTQYLVLGHFDVEEEGSLHLRYAMLIPDADEVHLDQLGQVLDVLNHQQQHFGDYLEAFCEGEMEIDDFAEFVAAGEAMAG